MYFGLPEIQFSIVTLAYRPGKVKYTSLRFKGKPKTCSKISIIDIIILAIISSPTKINKSIEKRILIHQVPILCGENGELR